MRRAYGVRFAMLAVRREGQRNRSHPVHTLAPSPRAIPPSFGPWIGVFLRLSLGSGGHSGRASRSTLIEVETSAFAWRGLLCAMWAVCAPLGAFVGHHHDGHMAQIRPAARRFSALMNFGRRRTRIGATRIGAHRGYRHRVSATPSRWATPSARVLPQVGGVREVVFHGPEPRPERGCSEP